MTPPAAETSLAIHQRQRIILVQPQYKQADVVHTLLSVLSLYFSPSHFWFYVQITAEKTDSPGKPTIGVMTLELLSPAE